MLREEALCGMAWEIQRYPQTDWSRSDGEPAASRNTASVTKLGMIAYLPASSDDARDQEHDSRLLASDDARNTAPVPKVGMIEYMGASETSHDSGNATVTKLGTIRRLPASDVEVNDVTVTQLLATRDTPHAQARMTSHDSGNATVTKLGTIGRFPASDVSDHYNSFVSSEPDSPHARKGRPVKRREDYSGSSDTRRHKFRRAAYRRRYTNRGSQGTRIGRPITHDGLRHARRRQRYAKGVQAKRILPYLEDLENVSGLSFERMVTEYGTTRELKGTLSETAAKLKLAQATTTTVLGGRSRFKKGFVQDLCNEHGMTTADVERSTTIPHSTVRDYRPRGKDAVPEVERNTRKRSKVNANNDLRNQAHPPNVKRNKMSPGEESAITEHAKSFMCAPSGSNNEILHLYEHLKTVYLDYRKTYKDTVRSIERYAKEDAGAFDSCDEDSGSASEQQQGTPGLQQSKPRKRASPAQTRNLRLVTEGVTEVQPWSEELRVLRAWIADRIGSCLPVVTNSKILVNHEGHLVVVPASASQEHVESLQPTARSTENAKQTAGGLEDAASGAGGSQHKHRHFETAIVQNVEACPCE